MLNTIKNFHHKKHGFTLIEIIVVLVIVAIMAAFVVPATTTYIKKSKEAYIYSEGYALLTTLQASIVREKALSDLESMATYKYNNSTDFSYHAITNFALVNAYKTMNDPCSQRIARYLLKHTFKDISYYSANDVYKKLSIAAIDKKIGSKYAMFVVFDLEGKIIELDYMRNGLMYIYYDGEANVYNTSDTKHTFCYKTESGSGGVFKGYITSYAK